MVVSDLRKAMLVVSFGTTVQATMELAIGACERTIAEAFPDRTVRRAFTSRIVRERLFERDAISVHGPVEALDQLRFEGYRDVVMQPLHIIPGEEFHTKVLAAAAGCRAWFAHLRVGRPLLFYTSDYARVITALHSHIPTLGREDAVVFMGHGSEHPANACYACLQAMLHDQDLPFFIANVEGYPDIGHVCAKLQTARVRTVHLMPLMLVAGEHARNDMASEAEDSWKNVLSRAGFSVQVHLRGLGENPLIQQIYVENARDAVVGRCDCAVAG